MVHIDYAGHYSLPDHGAAEDGASLIEYLDDISVLDASASRICGMNPDRLIHIAILAFDLAGRGFPGPGDIIALGMDSPPAVVGHQEQRILLGPSHWKAFHHGFRSFQSSGVRRSLLIIREVFGQPLGIELQLAGGVGRGFALRVFDRTSSGQPGLSPSLWRPGRQKYLFSLNSSQLMKVFRPEHVHKPTFRRSSTVLPSVNSSYMPSFLATSPTIS